MDFIKVKSFLRQTFFAETLLRDSEWEDEFHLKEKQFFAKFSPIFILVTGLIQLAHLFFFDIPMDLQPPELWVKYRVGMFAMSLSLIAILLFSNIKHTQFYKWPLILDISVLCYMQAMTRVWWDGVPFFYVYLFVLIGTAFCRLNLFWSLFMAGGLFVIQWPLFMEANLVVQQVVSAIVVAMALVLFLRLRYKADIEAFLNEKRTAKAEKEVLEKELELSGAVQSLLLPKVKALKANQFDIAGTYIPAASCSGDWWWYGCSKKKLRVLVGDVTGHGAGPAMVTASLTSLTHELTKSDIESDEILRRFNQYFYEFLDESEYKMTMVAVDIDLNNNKLQSWSAAAPPLFAHTLDNEFDCIGQAGSLLGTAPEEFKLGYSEAQFSIGASLFIFTDGLYETIHPKTQREFGLNKLSREFRKVAQEDCDAILRKTINVVQEFRGDGHQDDDYTCVALKLNPTR